MKYAIVDIETTGGRANQSRITEIAIILFDGEKVIDRFESLINPEVTIPYNITQITGITDEMVEDAPKFFEVAKRIVEITKGAIFVAHNVSFDYNFVKKEFARLGYKFMRKQLCTVRLSRQTFPGQRSYNLDAMARYLNVENVARHRAMGDTEVCFTILKTILAQQKAAEDIDTMINRGVKASKLPPNITLEQLHEFPEETGVYYFHNDKGVVTYVGKSINIKKRLLEHFANTKPKAQKMNASVHEITYKLTGSELAALLFESDQIKKIRPMYNRAQRRTRFPLGIHHYENSDGYICFKIVNIKDNPDVLAEYPKGSTAQNTLFSIASKFELCKPLCNVEGKLGENCLNFQLNLCRGACMNKEPVEEYNERAMRAVEKLKLVFDGNFFLLEQSMSHEEYAVVLIQNGVYQGFGYINTNDGQTIEDLKECIEPFNNNPDVSRIIKQYIKTKKTYRMIRF